MEHVIVTILAGLVDSRVLKTVHATVDFIYYTQYQSHTDIMLARMQDVLDIFHSHKDILLELYPGEDFNIPKVHSMLHYLDSICSLGSADRYNSESPKWLHIDYAKEAYCASNGVDFVPQIMKWLQHQEAVNRHLAYLNWFSAVLTSTSHDMDSRCFTLSEIIPGHAYCLMKTCPFPSLPINCLKLTFGALDFMPTFQAFLTEHKPNSRILASNFDRFNVYKYIVVLLSNIPHISDNNQQNKLCACCTYSSSLASSCKSDIPACFNTVPINYDCNLHQEMEGLHGELSRLGDLSKCNLTCIVGLHNAQIYVIFTLLAHYSTFSHPLAYIEWFCPFSTIDKTVGMYKVVQLTHNRARHSAVVSVNMILQACHLALKYRSVPVTDSWLHLNVLDNATEFYLNHYIDFDLFAMMQAD